MKQIITAEQLEELSDKAYEKYLDWMIEKNYNQGFGRDHIVLMNIGQMVEFLTEIYGKRVDFAQSKNYKDPKSDWRVEVKSNEYMAEELTDALWQAVKGDLENGKPN